MQAAYQAYHDAGFEIIGVSLDESKAAVVDFVKTRKLPWPQIHNGGAATDLVEAFGVRAIPATYLIDPEGTIIRIDLRGKALDETLARLLKTASGTHQRKVSRCEPCYPRDPSVRYFWPSPLGLRLGRAERSLPHGSSVVCRIVARGSALRRAAIRAGVVRVFLMSRSVS